VAKQDPKDERIAELELQLEAANKATNAAEDKAQEAEALRAQVRIQAGELDERAKKISALEAELEALKAASSGKSKATVTGLDPEKAVQLKVSSLVVSAHTKGAVVAVAGDVLCLVEVFQEVSRKVGTSAKVHPVGKEEIEAARKSGRAY
jgi:predicted RNase H-like nuclease (RuvC/YqgF family)